MNWIKSNPFLSGLIGITTLLCGILYFLASNWSEQYDQAKAGFDEAFQSVSTAESIPVYPIADLRDGKSKALTAYREAIANLEKSFDKYRPKKAGNIAPQAFTDRLLAANNEVTKAFGDTALPENFFLGFEEYRSQLAKSEATGTLLHQMDGMKAALLALAKSRPSALINLFRTPTPEETGGVFQSTPNDLARYYSYELTFKGSEQSVRDFLNALGETDTHYFIIRSMKIMNERDIPPNIKDAKFESNQAKDEAVIPTSPFGGDFFATPNDDAEAADESSKPSDESQITPPAPAVDKSQILAQILGKEELIVFVRFDLAMFLPTKELPKP